MVVKTKFDLSKVVFLREKPKAVVLLSGGIDSSTLLYFLDKDYDCFPLSVLYGQKHSREIDAAEVICDSLGVLGNWKLINLPQLGAILPSSLTSRDQSIPEGHYADESMKSTVVPNRNMILLAIAAGYAQGIGAGYVAYAPHKGDHTIYPDCRPDFIESVGETIRLGTGWEEEGVSLLTPFSHLNKAQIISMAKNLDVPLKDTWSCYKGGRLHCGKCGTCFERREAFKEAEVNDPTRYEE